MWHKSLEVGQFFLYIAVPWLILRSPSIIVGLTPYPRAQGIWRDWIAPALQFLSTAQHSDSPGTYKRPFTLATPPVNMLQSEDTKRTKPPTPPPGAMRPALVFAVITTIAIGVASSLALSSCAGNPLDAAVSTLAALRRANSAAATAFVAYDKAYQQQIVEEDKAGGRPERTAPDLALYRSKRIKIVGVQVTLTALLEAADSSIQFAQAMQAAKKPQAVANALGEVEQLLEQATTAVNQLQAGVRDLIGLSAPAAVSPSPAVRS